MARVGVVGIGYVGLATGIALAKSGNRVVLADSDSERVNAVEAGRAPFYEAGFDTALRSLRRRNALRATEDTSEAVKGARFVFLCVGTPSREDGSLNTDYLVRAASVIGDSLPSAGKRSVVVVKSTVLPGTTEDRVVPALEKHSGARPGEFGVCVNPEFLREGHALEDSLSPSHFVIGQSDARSGDALLSLFPHLRCRILRTSVRIAEAVKYATNSFLATKVTFANELANICTRLGLDVDDVIRGVTLDPRISPHHLKPGPGFGGSCFPKDLRALVSFARTVGYDPALLTSVLEVNERQPLELVRLLQEEVGSIAGKRVAILGLSFKEGVDDIRESKALALAAALLHHGAAVVGYDPRAGPGFARAAPGVTVVESVEAALRAADACVVQAAWPEFSRLRSKDFSGMTTRVVIDARRTWPSGRLPKGIRYRRIG